MLLERALRRDRALVIAGLLGVTLLAWADLWLGAGLGGDAMPEMESMAPAPWSPGHAALVALMWAAMMAAMSHSTFWLRRTSRERWAGWAITKSLKSSAAAAWAWCCEPSTRSCTESWPSR